MERALIERKECEPWRLRRPGLDRHLNEALSASSDLACLQVALHPLRLVGSLASKVAWLGGCYY